MPAASGTTMYELCQEEKTGQSKGNGPANAGKYCFYPTFLTTKRCIASWSLVFP